MVNQFSINGNGMQSRYLTNAYSNMANAASGSFGDEPLLSFGGSNGFAMNPMMGAMNPMMMGGMGMGYGPGSEVMNMSQTDYLKYQEQMENYQIDKQVRQQKKLATAEFQANASQDVITQKIRTLKEVIAENEQDHVSDGYGALKAAIRTKFAAAGYTNVPEDQVNAYANKLYTQATGKPIEEALKEHGNSSFVRGLKQGAFFGLGAMLTSEKSAQQNIADVTGTEVSTTDKAMNAVGIGVSAVATGALALVALPLLLRGGKGGAKGLGKVISNQWAKLFSSTPKAAAVATP